MPSPVFTLDDARKYGLRKDQVYTLLDSGEVERVGRGVYVTAGAVDPALTALAGAGAVREPATLCLTSVLVRHELIDEIPFAADIALPRGSRAPAGFGHVAWHGFDRRTFEIGRERIPVAKGITRWSYTAPRTLVDCFRLMHQEGGDVAYTALRRWLQRHGNTPGQLLDVASAFPKARPGLRQALEVLT